MFDILGIVIGLVLLVLIFSGAGSDGSGDDGLGAAWAVDEIDDDPEGIL